MSMFDQMLLDTHDELSVDLFAGGGGASLGFEMATGRQIDVAINHDAAAVAMHLANHPTTMHHTCDVFEVDPRIATGGRPVGFLWASPDCTFHSKARGAKPIRSKTKKRRALAWVVTRWAGQVRPRVIMLENVEEFAQWGPLIGKPDQLRPCPRRRGKSFRRWVRSLRELGYTVEWRELRACDYGAPTIRKRLFLIARCDGQPIVWPEPTHSGASAELEGARSALAWLKRALQQKNDEIERGDLRSQIEKHEKRIRALKQEVAENSQRNLKPFRTASECIDWTIPMLSIFATKEEARAWGKSHGQASPIRPLAENTERRIARGVKRYVIENPKPFLVNVANSKTTGRGPNTWPGEEPLRTVTSSNGFAVVNPSLMHLTHEGERPGVTMDEPVPTITAAQRGELGLIAPIAVTVAHGEESPSGAKRRGKGARSLEEPHSTLQCSNDTGLVAASITKFRGGATGHELTDPLHTITSNSNETSRPGGSVPLGIVAASLSTYYGDKGPLDARGAKLDEPLATQTTENRHALIAAHLNTCNNSRDPLYGADEPANSIVSDGARHNLVASFLAQNNAAANRELGRSVADPLATVAANGSGHHGLVAASLIEQHGTAHGESIEKPVQTIAAGGQHHGLVASHLMTNTSGHSGAASDEPVPTMATGGHQSLVAAFLQKYYGTGGDQGVTDPAHTIPTVDRFGLVTVTIEGQTYVISDIAMRMLQPRELYRAQGFPDGYIIDRGADGEKLTKTEQVRMVGNSVVPPVAAALVKANVPEMIGRKELRAS